MPTHIKIASIPLAIAKPDINCDTLPGLKSKRIALPATISTDIKIGTKRIVIIPSSLNAKTNKVINTIAAYSIAHRIAIFLKLFQIGFSQSKK